MWALIVGSFSRLAKPKSKRGCVLSMLQRLIGNSLIEEPFPAGRTGQEPENTCEERRKALKCLAEGEPKKKPRGYLE